MAGRIKGITVEIGGDTTGLDKALKGVNNTIKTTQSNLKDVNRLLKLDPGNTTLVSQKQKELKTAINATKEKLEALKVAQEQAKKQLEEGTLGQEKYDALQREIVETEQELLKLQQQAATTSKTLEKMDAVGTKMEAVGGSIKSAGKKMLGVTAVVGGLGAAAVKTTAEFDTSMAKVSAVSGATGDDLQVLRDKAREMGAKTKFSASEAADAMNYMAMAGWKTSDITGSGTVYLSNGFMPVVPMITLTASTTLSWTKGGDSFSKTLSAGTWQIPELELEEGNSTVTVSGSGRTTFRYREGQL